MASATAITLANMVTTVSGTASIATVNPPSLFESPTVYLIPTGAFALVTGGNIGAATTAIVGQVQALTWDGSKWWPSYINTPA